MDAEEYRHRRHDTWGRPLPGVEFRVVDADGKDLPWDGKSVGELLVRGDMVMKGYYAQPEETAKTLEGGWYHTGDLCALEPDGQLIVKDRKKDIIISGGENISSLEIEQVLYGHPAILECAVIGKNDEKWGEIPLALIVLREGYRDHPGRVHKIRPGESGAFQGAPGGEDPERVSQRGNRKDFEIRPAVKARPNMTCSSFSLRVLGVFLAFDPAIFQRIRILGRYIMIPGKIMHRAKPKN